MHVKFLLNSVSQLDNTFSKLNVVINTQQPVELKRLSIFNNARL